jgi:hypothetical protein
VVPPTELNAERPLNGLRKGRRDCFQAKIEGLTQARLDHGAVSGATSLFVFFRICALLEWRP